MGSRIILVFCAVFITSCSGKPLSQAECQTVANKEIDYTISLAPASDVSSLKQHLVRDVSNSAAQCLAGHTYRRSDYQCMIRAGDSRETDECIQEVSARIYH